MRPSAFVSCFAIYCTIWVVTFGHAVNRPADCSYPYIKDEWTREYLTDSCRDLSGLDAMVFSMFWPFYWSAQAFKAAE